MSDAMSEIYRGMREDDERQELWKEQIKKSPILYNNYERLIQKISDLKEMYEFELSLAREELELTRTQIINK